MAVDDQERSVAAAGVEHPSIPAGAVPPSGGDSLRRAVRWLDSHALFIAGVAAVIVLSCAGVPAHLAQDGWLALVAGRIIAQHGIPHHDYLTVMAYGVRWTDQQWLAQLAIYRLQQLGGLALFSAFYIALTGAALAMGIAAGRRLGGEERHVIWVLPIAAFFYLVTAVSIRTQGFAYPLFVVTLWLLAAEARSPTPRRVYLVFPLLVLWANLHGSVTLGVGLAVIYGGILLVGGFRAERWRGLAQRRGWAFLIGAPLCLFATPYGVSIFGYYRVTLLNPEFSKLVTEWEPVTSYTILAIPFLLLVVVTIWAIGRSGARTPVFDQLALTMLGLGGIFAVRNITWFGLAVIMLLPAVISGLAKEKPPAPRRRSLNLAIAWTSIALVLIGMAVVFTKPASWFESTYPKRAVSIVAGIVRRDPSAKIFADVRYADWLVWHDPGLAGHIAYDTSLENLTEQQLQSIADLGEAIVPGTPDPLARYSVLVLAPSNKTVNRILLHRPGVKVILRSKRVIIATKPIT
jgi:hypothetical protein